MAAGDTNLTMIGNLVSDPELRFTPSGAAVAKFTVASTPRYLDKTTNEWKDGDSLFLQCQIWRQAAENVAESLTKGMRVIVSGRLKQRSYETKEGEKRTVFEVEVDEVGPSLRNATAKVTKAARQTGTGYSAIESVYSVTKFKSRSAVFNTGSGGSGITSTYGGGTYGTSTYYIDPTGSGWSGELARVQDYLPKGIENQRYLGCKLTSPGFNVNSTQTIDGKPVVEFRSANPNQLIYQNLDNTNGSFVLV